MPTSLQHLHSYDKLKTLSDPRRLSILRWLMRSPATLSQLGRQFGEHPAWIRHHIKQLEQAGLVEMSDVQMTSRYVEKYYTARASAFFLQELLLPESLPGKPVVIISGSHDLALEALTSLASSALDVIVLPIGSLDGLIALRQGFCQIAGCHLLDPVHGEYNTSYVSHIFPDQPMSLFTLAHRQQGLLVAPGNPKGILSIYDLPRQDVTMINRNQGSGTSLWLDHQLKRLGIPAAQVQGYDRLANTHTDVARAILQGHADVGLGIQAAALADHLDFIPLFHERFDLVMPIETLNEPALSPLFDHLTQPAFHRQMQSLGGYDTSQSGKLSEVRL